MNKLFSAGTTIRELRFEFHFLIHFKIDFASWRPAALGAAAKLLDPVALLRISMMRELFNIMHHAKQLPLAVDLGFAAQCEAVQSLVAAQVAKHWFHRCEAARDHLAPRIGVDLRLHQVEMVFSGIALPLKEGDLAHFGFFWRTQAFSVPLARYAVLGRTGKFFHRIAIDGAVRAVAVEPLAGRAYAVGMILGQVEICGLEAFRFFGVALLFHKGSGLAACTF